MMQNDILIRPLTEADLPRVLEIENRYDFIDLDDFNGIWQVMKDGECVQRGRLDLTGIPGAFFLSPEKRWR